MHKHSPRFTFALCLLGALIVAPAAARQPDPQRLARIPAKMQEFVDRGIISGAVTVVGRHDGILCYDAVGKRDLAAGLPMTKDTLFRIASMTKPVTALGILLLVDEGRLALDDLVERHLPEFRGQMLVASRTANLVTLKKPTRPITLRDLLTHTSGLPSAYPPGLADLMLRRNHSLAEAIMAQSQRPLDFEPGSKWSYCNAGIDTLGRVIEVVSGQAYETFLQQRIFAPLGMNDTTFYLRDEQRPRVAKLYEVVDGRLREAADRLLGQARDARFPIPCGGLYSTGGDLARLYQMFLNGGRYQGRQLVSKAALGEMTRLQTGKLKAGFVPGMGFGLGVGFVREPQGVTAMLSPGTFGHGGAFATQGWIDPHQDLFMILLIQRLGLKPNGDDSELRREFQALAVEAVK
jgi:CubicO group peptidase (beta-lactamase class C family)